ncbi:MAG: D-tyrosyl-tRNA(Tyr) deacylase [Gammaproteobacteria bacterium]|nr:D-tyrosyl-tRNA(Tyr) deacylase [Gammaproteobacteria bacterium]|tara:strand:- start:3504 stop:3941 length:438 start_codon:yes stop_codon:yes gene_type:complete
MKALLQRVTEAAVTVDGERIASIGPGLLVFVGVQPGDGPEDVDWLAGKVLALRIFPDADKPMNRSVTDVGGELLLVSQFTLAADTRRGNRPGFSTAAPPEQAERLYDAFVAELRRRWDRVATGRFGADMQVSLINDGPVTFLLER